MYQDSFNSTLDQTSSLAATTEINCSLQPDDHRIQKRTYCDTVTDQQKNIYIYIRSVIFELRIRPLQL